MNEIKILTAAQRKDGLTAMEKAEFRTIRSGLKAGKYRFVTSSGSIYGLKPITSKDGRKWGLTIVAGVLTGVDAGNSHVHDVYGLGENDKQLVFTSDQFMEIVENQTYDLVANEKGRVASITPINVNIVSSEEVITKSKKQRAVL